MNVGIRLVSEYCNDRYMFQDLLRCNCHLHKVENSMHLHVHGQQYFQNLRVHDLYLLQPYHSCFSEKYNHLPQKSYFVKASIKAIALRLRYQSQNRAKILSRTNDQRFHIFSPTPRSKVEEDNGNGRFLHLPNLISYPHRYHQIRKP